MSRARYGQLRQSWSEYFLLGAIILCTCVHAAQVAAGCQKYLRPPVAQEWRDFRWTSPAAHNATNFRYRVHAVPPLYLLNRSLEQIYDRLTSSPQALPISFSVITNDQPNPIAGRNGFILEFEPENIIVANSDDLKSFVYLQKPNWLEAIQGDYSIQTPDQMLSKKTHMWNEGLVFNLEPNTGKRVRVIGAYGYRHSEDAKVFEEFAKTKSIPFVWLN